MEEISININKHDLLFYLLAYKNVVVVATCYQGAYSSAEKISDDWWNHAIVYFRDFFDS